MKQAAAIGATLLLLSGCANPPHDNKDGAGEQDVTQHTQTVHTYRCASGATITAIYPTTESAEVLYQGRTYLMRSAVSASGARYVGDDREWWTRGSGPGAEGTLFRHLPDKTSGEPLEVCTES
ncbi:MAG: hypothetical protein CME43_05490 [Haliea sp.]|jgi:membrane-bound inhibitor of C-type lysozyme|uniref:MliC family protein n=1 Tax=Haliea sp. TaxID=1932666 RepID=UPI000C698352|nr:MliC family protein [Haliea sp.]MBM68911.1 hypothetical protein [Haliea sp.]|tara:strand:- start:20535 stop:20903 length:369 start_codon:yes stop_codon:yes gene_type:complete